MNKITACIDGSDISGYLCDAAAWLGLSLSIPVKLLHVLERSVVPANENLSGAIGLGSREHLLKEMVALDEQRAKLALEHGKHMLDDARQRISHQGVADIEVKQRHGELLEALLEVEANTRVFVLGKSGEDHTLHSRTIGSHLENIVRAIHTPILVTVGAFKTPENYMIAYDGSPMADAALAKFASSPLMKSLPGHLVLVGENSHEHQQKLYAAQSVLESSGRMITPSIVQGGVLDALDNYRLEHGIDMVVMGAYGHSRIREFFVGSHTSKVIATSPVPLLLLR